MRLLPRWPRAEVLRFLLVAEGEAKARQDEKKKKTIAALATPPTVDPISEREQRANAKAVARHFLARNRKRNSQPKDIIKS